MIDAHCHLHFPILQARASALIDEMADAGIHHAIVNGTCEHDWQDVAQLCTRFPALLRPAYGLHPWKILQRTSSWHENLALILASHPHASIGECGIDHWRIDLPKDQQREVFAQHIALSRQYDRPMSIHGLKAWQAIAQEIAAQKPIPPFLLHSYSGPVDMIPHFAKLGAYFSFSAYFFEPRKVAVLEMFRSIPTDRLLIETDAPDMKGPAHLYPEFSAYPFHHPRALSRTAALLALFLHRDCSELEQQTDENAKRLFRL